jgi:hypothetical protein
MLMFALGWVCSMIYSGIITYYVFVRGDKPSVIIPGKYGISLSKKG